MSTTADQLIDPARTAPMQVVKSWLDEACKLRRQRNPNSMVLATTAADGEVSARVVLCKGLVAEPGYLVFYTNYESRKGRELARSAHAAVVMHWDDLQRQVRITGPVLRSPAAESDAYFASRPWPSRLAAWASQQSAPIGTRDELIAAVQAAARRFGTPDPAEPAREGVDFVIPRPPHWGGYRLWVENVELWQEGKSRIHDRLAWSRTLTPEGAAGFRPGPWTVTRLQP